MFIAIHIVLITVKIYYSVGNGLRTGLNVLELIEQAADYLNDTIPGMNGLWDYHNDTSVLEYLASLLENSDDDGSNALFSIGCPVDGT